MKPGDNLTLVFIVIVLICVVVNRFFSLSSIGKWLFNNPRPEEKIKGRIPDELRNLGFECIAQKCKVPIDINVDDTNYSSRLFTDYIVKKNGRTYVVFVSRSRKPMRRTGSALRDFFLYHYLLYKPSGIIYIDSEDLSIKQVKLKVYNNNPSLKKKKDIQKLNILLIGFIMGFIIAGIIYKG